MDIQDLEKELLERLSKAWASALKLIKYEWERLRFQGNLSLASALLAVRRILHRWPEDIARANEDYIKRMYATSFASGFVDTELKIVPDQGDLLAIDWITHQRNGFIPALQNMSQENTRKIERILKESFQAGNDFDLNKMTLRVEDEVGDVGKSRAELIVRTETAKISALGRIFAWGKDSDRDWYNYYWIATPDDRVKDISLKFEREGPYDYDTIKRIWEKDHQEPQLVRNRHTRRMEYQISAFNCRCSVARSPKREEQLINEGKISNREWITNI